MSTNNIPVVPAAGYPAIGSIAAQPGLPLVGGTLTALNGTLATVTRPGGSTYRDYLHNLRVLVAEASRRGWPDAPGSVLFGHNRQATGPALPPPRFVGAEPFQDANPDNNLQTLLGGNLEPRTCSLGVSEATDVAPFPSGVGAAIG